MNGTYGNILKPTTIRIENIEKGFGPKFLKATEAAKTIIDPNAVKTNTEYGKTTVREAVINSFVNPLKTIDEYEYGGVDEYRQLVIGKTDIQIPIQDLYMRAEIMPDAFDNAMDKIYENSLEIYNKFQYAYNQEIWDAAIALKQQIGEGTTIIEVAGGGN